MGGAMWMPDHRTPVHCVQLECEFDWLLAIVHDLAPRRILEIGAHTGGTLYHWMQTVPVESAFTVVSLGATPHIPLWKTWADAHGHGLEILDADSTAPESVRWMQQQQPYDFIFIDGSHWWEYVSQDWGNARTMIRPGGIIAFHDITPHGVMPNERVDVPRLWQEIKASGVRTDEYIAAPGRRCGIGVVYL